MRYVILEGHTTFAVLDTSRPEYPRHVCRGTEAEARICAFALNATAAGRWVASVPGEFPESTATPIGSADVRAYHGPTEGVAP